MFHNCLDDCIDSGFDYSAAYEKYGSEWANEQLEIAFDLCWDHCEAKIRTDNVNTNETPASKSTVPANEDATSGTREFWGAAVFGADYDSGTTSYGLSWNYPSQESAIQAAIYECSRRIPEENCDQSLGNIIDRFSTSAPYESDFVFRTRCFAVVSFTPPGYNLKLYTGVAGETKMQAESRANKKVSEWGNRAFPEQSVCNSQ